MVGVWSKCYMFVLQKIKTTKKIFFGGSGDISIEFCFKNFPLYDSAVNMRHRIHFVPTADETPIHV